MDFTVFAAQIFSRLFELASPAIRKGVMNNLKKKRDFLFRGMRLQEKEVSRRKSLLHQRIVDAVANKKAVVFLIPFLEPLTGKDAGPLRVDPEWTEAFYRVSKMGALPASLYLKEDGTPDVIFCSSEPNRLVDSEEIGRVVEDLVERYDHRALEAFVAAAWIEAVCYANYLFDNAPENEKTFETGEETIDECAQSPDPEVHFVKFFWAVSKKPSLHDRMNAVGLFPSEFFEKEDKDVGSSAQGENLDAGDRDSEEKDSASVSGTVPSDISKEERKTALERLETSASEESVSSEEAGQTQPSVEASEKKADIRVGSNRSAETVRSSVDCRNDPVAENHAVPVDPDPGADDGAPIPTVFNAPALETEPVSGRPAGCTRSLVYAMMTGGSFWNLYFVANLDDKGDVLYLSTEELARRFPKYGAVNIRFPVNARVPLSLGNFYVLDWSEVDLEVNHDAGGTPREDYYYRVDGQKIYREGRLTLASRFALFPVVRPQEEGVNDLVKIDWRNHIAVTTGDTATPGVRLSTGAQVLLRVRDKLIGPITIKENAKHRSYVVFPSEVHSSGLVEGFTITSSSIGENLFLEVEQFRPDTFGYVPVTLVCTRNLLRKRFDVRSDSDLLSEACDATARTKTERDALTRLLALEDERRNPFEGNPEVADARAKRLRRLLAGLRKSDDWVESVGKLFMELFDHLSESKSAQKGIEALVARLLKEPQLPRKLESYGEVADRIKQLRDEAKFVENENAKKERDAKATLTQLNSEIAAREREIQGLKREKAAVEKTLLADVQDEVDALERRKALLAGEVDRAGERLREAFANAGRYSFDGVVAAKLTEAAAAWEDEQRKRNFDDRAKAIAALPLCPKEENALKHHLLEGVAEYRSYYPANDVLNLFILLTQNFLTILSGPPGAGKTSICGILAHAMGLTTLHAQPALQEKVDLWADLRDVDRYLPVSVERGWTSKRDFIGYYNPLTKTFESLDARRYEAFAELNAEKKAKCESVPYLMLLDEANLSPMEYYFADFMNICDERTDLSFISLGDKMRYAIPDTLRFVATINDDFTTENLSPRLLDRAAVATLPEADPSFLTSLGEKQLDLDTPRPIVAWPAMKALFGARKDLDADGLKAKAALDDLCTFFATLNGPRTPVSPRTRISSLAYVSAAVKVFEKSDRPVWVVALDYVCAQRLLPRINGNGPHFRGELEKLRKRLKDYELHLSKRLLDNLIARGDMEMDFYRFCG